MYSRVEQSEMNWRSIDEDSQVFFLLNIILFGTLKIISNPLYEENIFDWEFHHYLSFESKKDIDQILNDRIEDQITDFLFLLNHFELMKLFLLQFQV